MKRHACVSLGPPAAHDLTEQGGHGRLVRVKGHTRLHPTRTPVNAR